MKKKFQATLSLLVVSLLFLAISQFAAAAIVFSDNFSSGGFANWKTYASPASSQTVNGGVARFIVPTPTGGNVTYSYLLKDGFSSTVNSTIVASEDIYVTKVPNGCPQGEGDIFFFYVCDSTDLSGAHGNFGVGIDGSDAWSIWIGGNPPSAYVFQTAGSAPASNTWYHLVLTINNPAALVTLEINGTTVINTLQQEFTDKTHSISLMTGMGEDWYCQGSGMQEIDVDNVAVSISDMTAPLATPDPTTQNPTPIQAPTQNSDPTTPTATTSPHSGATPKPSETAAPTHPSPSPTESPSPSTTDPERLSLSTSDLWVGLVLVAAIVCCAGYAALAMLKKR